MAETSEFGPNSIPPTFVNNVENTPGVNNPATSVASGPPLSFPQDQQSYLGSVRFTPQKGRQINMFLPNSLQSNDDVSFDNTDIGVLGAAALGTGATQGTSISDTGEFVGGQNAGWQDMLKLGINQIAKNMGDKVGGVARLASKTSPNPNTRAIFNKVNLRQFVFDFTLIPKNESEAQTIGSIITEFRTRLYPEELNQGVTFGDRATNVPAGYKFPTQYFIEVFYNGQDMSHAYHLKTVGSYLTAVRSNYNPNTATFFKGKSGLPYFSEISLNLVFMEGKTLSTASVEAGY